MKSLSRNVLVFLWKTTRIINDRLVYEIRHDISTTGVLLRMCYLLLVATDDAHYNGLPQRSYLFVKCVPPYMYISHKTTRKLFMFAGAPHSGRYQALLVLLTSAIPGPVISVE